MIELGAYILKALMGGRSSTQLRGSTNFRSKVPGRTMKMITPTYGKKFSTIPTKKNITIGRNTKFPTFNMEDQ